MPHQGKRQVPLALQTLALLVVLPCSYLFAGESWEKKAYTEWTASEALKVLTDSPWSKTAIVQELGSIATGQTPLALSNRRRPGEPCCTSKGDDGAAAESGAFGATSGWGSAPVSQVLYFRVIFLSSVRVRQALARLDQLAGKTMPSETSDQLQGPLADYVIALAGPLVGAFQAASVDVLKGVTYLQSRKRGGMKLELKGFAPPNPLTDGMALFVFPRGAEGKPPFDLADGQVEFATGEGRSKIRASFKIDKMAVSGALDF